MIRLARTPSHHAFDLGLVVALTCALLTASAHARGEALPPPLAWSELPALPDAHGFAGGFAGVSHDGLIFAGGANFPDGRPWDGAEKLWHDTIFILPDPDGEWRQAETTLLRPLAYGASITWQDRVIVIGGCDHERHFADVFAMRLNEDGAVSIESWPSLPEPLAYHSAVLIGDRIYVAGGRSSPDAAHAEHVFWALDLAKPQDQRRWASLDPWPGPARMLAVAGGLADHLYLFSGTDLVPGDDGAPQRRYLTDAYRYDIKRGTWQRLTDLPRPAVAAPSPAPVLGNSHLLVLGGDTGEHAHLVDQLRDDHPGFTPEILAYHAITDSWSRRGSMPKDPGPDPANDPQAGTWPPVTTPTVWWHDKLVVASGEARPGVRTHRVLWATPGHSKEPFGAVNFIVLGIYLSLLVGMGFYFSRREHSTHDFFLGGRRIPWWAAGLSVFGTQLSAITFMAIPAHVYATDWTYILANMMIVVAAPLVVFLYLPFYRRLNVTSAYEYLEKRFNVAARLLGSAAFILFQLGRMGIVLFLPSLALSAVTGMDIYLCIALMGVLATLYTVLGGIEAVVWTDVVQVVLLLGGALLALGIIVFSIDGGVGRIVSMANEHDKFRVFNFSWDIAQATVWVILVGQLAANLVSYTSDQTVVQRYLTTIDEKAAARSIWTNAALTIPASLIFFATGTALWAFYKAQPDQLAPLTSSDQIFPWFIAHQLPIGVGGLVIAALFAAAMSSLDSSMNSMATTLTTDWYRRFKADVNERRALALARWLTVLLGAFGTCAALLMAIVQSASLWTEYLGIVGMFGGGLGGLFAAGIFTRRITGLDAVVGFFFSAALMWIVTRFTDTHPMLYAAVGMGACVGIAYLVSWFTPGPTQSLAGLTIYTLRDGGTADVSGPSSRPHADVAMSE